MDEGGSAAAEPGDDDASAASASVPRTSWRARPSLIAAAVAGALAVTGGTAYGVGAYQAHRAEVAAAEAAQAAAERAAAELVDAHTALADAAREGTELLNRLAVFGVALDPAFIPQADIDAYTTAVEELTGAVARERGPDAVRDQLAVARARTADLRVYVDRLTAAGHQLGSGLDTNAAALLEQWNRADDATRTAAADAVAALHAALEDATAVPTDEVLAVQHALGAARDSHAAVVAAEEAAAALGGTGGGTGGGGGGRHPGGSTGGGSTGGGGTAPVAPFVINKGTGFHGSAAQCSDLRSFHDGPAHVVTIPNNWTDWQGGTASADGYLGEVSGHYCVAW